jgi:anti-sigma B factor antagonist
MDAAALAVEREHSFSSHTRVLALRGQIDLYSAPIFQAALSEAVDDGVVDLTVDVTEVDFLDSTALGLLAAVSKRLRRLGGTLAIVSEDETITRVFELTGLATRLEVRRR